MKPVRVIAVGEKMPGWVDEACNSFLERFSHPFELELNVVKAEKRHRNSYAEDIRLREWTRLQEQIPAASMVVLLDESGNQLDTMDLKNKIQHWRDTGNTLVFLIGGADGFPRESIMQAAYSLALSRLTLPHGLARVLLLEQIYRVSTLLAGHPYHRD